MEKFALATLKYVTRLCEAGYYDYIIVGSGIGGGVLARTLVDESESPGPPRPARVLVIERGGILFNTHCLNVPAPRWNSHSLEGPSMDNSMVYDTVKEPVFTVTSRSDGYVGGPVFSLGGRSTVWGLYTPTIDRPQVEHFFPSKVYEYLFGYHSNESKDSDSKFNSKGEPAIKSGYNKAYQVLTNDQKATIGAPYPMNGSVQENVIDIISKVKVLLNELRRPKHKKLYTITREFLCCPMAAEFTFRDPGSRMYHMPMGGYSTVSWILDRILNRSEHLNVLAKTRVISVNKARITVPPSIAGEGVPVESLTVLDECGKERILPTGGAKVILSAGSIDTAVIALRSGLQGKDEKSLVAHGLTDHDIWGTRFVFWCGSVLEHYGGRALRLDSWVTMEGKDGKTTPDSERCLLNITINADSFLGHSRDKEIPTEYFDRDMKLITHKEFMELPQPNPTGDSEKEPPKPIVVMQIVYCFAAQLRHKNRVLGLPESVPTIEVSKKSTSMYVPAMQELAQDIREVLLQNMGFPEESSQAIPAVGRADFGVVAHEVGTMRMPSPGKEEESVVDEDLKVRGWRDLFVCDLSVFPVSPAANPTLTLAALSQRLGTHLEKERQNTSESEKAEAHNLALIEVLPDANR